MIYNKSVRMDSGQSPPDPDSPETSSSRQNFRRRILFSEECGVTGELVFRREGVLVRPRRGDTLIAGVLEVVETKAQGVFITWDRDTEDSEQSNGRVIINDQVGSIIACHYRTENVCLVSAALSVQKWRLSVLSVVTNSQNRPKIGS